MFEPTNSETVWPTLGYVEQAEVMLRKWVASGFKLSALPESLARDEWALPMCSRKELFHWAIERRDPVGMIGFQLPPSETLVSLVLSHAGIDEYNLKDFQPDRQTIAALEYSHGAVKQARIAFDSGPFRDLDEFHRRLRRMRHEFDIQHAVIRVDCLVGGSSVHEHPDWGKVREALKSEFNDMWGVDRWDG